MAQRPTAAAAGTRTSDGGAQRRTPLPGISSTASALRSRRNETRAPPPAAYSDELDFEVETPGDAALDELPSGIIMPGKGSGRAPFPKPADEAQQASRVKTLKAPPGPRRGARTAAPKLPARPGTGRPLSAQPKGTPARLPRYSLPVRAEKPVRASKLSGRHVLLPSESQLAPLAPSRGAADEDDEDEDAEDADGALPRALRVPRRPVYTTFEHMAPHLRVHTRLPRLASYAISASLHLPTLLAYLRREHGVRPRLYEGCAYVLYFKPLLPGFGRSTVRSSREPQTGSPGAESRHEREIQRHEESGYEGEYFVPLHDQEMDTEGYIPSERHEAPATDGYMPSERPDAEAPPIESDAAPLGTLADRAGARDMLLAEEPITERSAETQPKSMGINEASHTHDAKENEHAPPAIRDALLMAELVVLPYGVVVMFNFDADEEDAVLADILSSGAVRTPHRTFDRELFHFCYDPNVRAPRIYNDFFTFRAPNHLLKLSLAHAIAQSCKLSEFEESMHATLELTSHLPRELAHTGELQLTRRAALRMSGRLFKLRVDVNLTSDVLDTPDLFWDEASLQALYDAIRDYLEIDQRAETLNERLSVANEMLEIIHEHLNNNAMSKITWIIILLIVAACVVAVGEISARITVSVRHSSAS